VSGLFIAYILYSCLQVVMIGFTALQFFFSSFFGHCDHRYMHNMHGCSHTILVLVPSPHISSLGDVSDDYVYYPDLVVTVRLGSDLYPNVFYTALLSTWFLCCLGIYSLTLLLCCLLEIIILWDQLDVVMYTMYQYIY